MIPFSGLVALTALVLVGWLLVTFAADFAAATGTPWQRALAATRQSATLLWARAQMLLAGLSALLVSLADYLGHPELDDAIKRLLRPEWVPAYIAVVALVTIWARNRTLAR